MLDHVDLRTWITAEHDAVLDRFERSVVDAVPLERWTDAVGTGGSSIAFLAFHTAYHADLAINAVLRAGQPLLAEWRAELGLAGAAASDGLAEAEPPELTAALRLDRLVPYVVAVHRTGASWLVDADLDELGATPDSAAGLGRGGVEESAVPWLHAMWQGKPAAWFIQWEAIGHRVNHLGEMVSVRNRLGLSPF